MDTTLQGSKEKGKVAKCQNGKLGVITSYSRYGGRSVYYGISFDGSHWQSIKPEIIANSLNEYLKQPAPFCEHCGQLPLGTKIIEKHGIHWCETCANVS